MSDVDQERAARVPVDVLNPIALIVPVAIVGVAVLVLSRRRTTPVQKPDGAAAKARPKTCTGPWDFISTDCQLTWWGITLYGVVDAGFGYQTHGAPLDTRSPPSSAYIVQRYSRSARWDVGRPLRRSTTPLVARDRRQGARGPTP